MILIRVLIAVGLIICAVILFNLEYSKCGAVVILILILWIKFGNLLFYTYEDCDLNIPGFYKSQFSLDYDSNYIHDPATGRYYQIEPDDSTVCDNCDIEYSGTVCPECQSCRTHRPVDGDSYIYKY